MLDVSIQACIARAFSGASKAITRQPSSSPRVPLIDEKVAAGGGAQSDGLQLVAVCRPQRLLTPQQRPVWQPRLFRGERVFPAPHHGQRFRTKTWALVRDCNAVTVNVRDRLTAILWSVMKHRRSLSIRDENKMRTFWLRVNP